MAVQTHHHGLNCRSRIERSGLEPHADPRLCVELHTHCQQAHIPRPRDHPLSYLALNGHHHPCRTH